MRGSVLVVAAALVGSTPAAAQTFNPFGDLHTAGTTWRSSGGKASAQSGGLQQVPVTQALLPGSQGQKFPPFMEGGPRPNISPATPATVPFASGHGAGSVVIDTNARTLYYVLSSSTAYRYPISVGRMGFQWTGTQSISNKVSWPDWRPPAEMRKRQPGLPEHMTGGISNPLGARALYLGSTLYRIHGTNDAATIGQAASSGCFRMTNAHVVHLSNLVSVGTAVHVLKSLPRGTRVAGGAKAS